MLNFENWDDFTLPGDKDYFMGSEPSEVDCALFGMLVMIVFNMPSSRHEKYVRGQYVLYLNVNGVNSALSLLANEIVSSVYSAGSMDVDIAFPLHSNP